jgi:hypothetical protein
VTPTLKNFILKLKITQKSFFYRFLSFVKDSMKKFYGKKIRSFSFFVSHLIFKKKFEMNFFNKKWFIQYKNSFVKSFVRKKSYYLSISYKTLHLVPGTKSVLLAIF